MKQNNHTKGHSNLTFADFEKQEKLITFSTRELIERVNIIVEKLQHLGPPNWSPVSAVTDFFPTQREGPESAAFSSLQTQEKIFTAWLNVMLAKPRKNILHLSTSEKEDFNIAIRAAINDGKYEALVQSHGDMSDKHGPPIGNQVGLRRFLPWHRAMLYQLEEVLQEYKPDIRIPYWDWTNDHNLPTWVVKPEQVTRGPDQNYKLPTQLELDQKVYSTNSYIPFTTALENKPFHNSVHMWAGGNLQDPMVSPRDPIFFLLHANVDRIWAIWQKTHPNQNPPLIGNEVQMGPWSMTVDDLLETYQLQYFYS
jgi:hypothetical protein